MTGARSGRRGRSLGRPKGGELASLERPGQVGEGRVMMGLGASGGAKTEERGGEQTWGQGWVRT